ncbi:adenosylcobinamide-phosphate synthase CbiB [Methylomonas sp. MgM2]
MNLILTLLIAFAVDYCVGEPRNAYHPLVAFGHWVRRLEKTYLNPEHSPIRQKAFGSLAVLCALLPCCLAVIVYWLPPILQTLTSIGILYFCVGARSLQQHAFAVYQALQQDDLAASRRRVGLMVSRQTDNMTRAEVRRASIESVLENGADAVFAPLFWFVALGSFGALLYRLANTLDAMWAYKNHRYLHFGWAAARLDDTMNWLPARLTAVSYAVLGDTQQAVYAWRHQAPQMESPNAGPVMASGAGALDIRLGGAAIYHGILKNKICFGGNKQPEDRHILLALRLVFQTLVLWLSLIAIAELLV